MDLGEQSAPVIGLSARSQHAAQTHRGAQFKRQSALAMRDARCRTKSVFGWTKLTARNQQVALESVQFGFPMRLATRFDHREGDVDRAQAFSGRARAQAAFGE